MTLVQVQQSGWTYDNGVTEWDSDEYRTVVSEGNRARILKRDNVRSEGPDGWHVEPLKEGSAHHVADWLPGGGGYARIRLRWEAVA